jgi:hypothetical protein
MVDFSFDIELKRFKKRLEKLDNYKIIFSLPVIVTKMAHKIDVVPITLPQILLVCH